MTSFSIHTQATAPAASQPLLTAVQGKYGFVPNLLAGMAEAPNVLKAYLDLAGATAAGTLTGLEQQIVQIVTSRLNSCEYCVAAHSTVSDMQKLPADVINAIREGKTIADSKLQALQQFTTAVVKSGGLPSTGDVDAFLKAGYTKAQSLEVVLSIGLKTIANYIEHVIHAPLDAAFQPRQIKLQAGTKAA
jgi:uncharacterized peroxidase-related enzyme